MQSSELCRKTRNLIVKYQRKIEEKTGKSRDYFKTARSVLAGGVTYKIRDFHPYPIYILKARGKLVFDVDGNVYTDYWMGHGALILGHANPVVVNSIKSQAELGTHYGYENPLAVKWAELIKRNYKIIESLRFTNSGTEANIYALRLARAYTRRKYVIKLKGGWHGSYNGLHINVHPPFTGKPESPGIPEEHGVFTISIELNDINRLRKIFEKKGNEIAAFIMEPILGAGGGVPASTEFAREARELCDKHNCLLIFDEVITGFRVSLKGGAGFLGVEPDLVVLGKIIGGGLPAGAFGGKQEIMELLDHRKYEKHVFQGGTFTGNPLTAAAGISTIKYLEENDENYQKLGKLLSLSNRLISELSEEFRIPIHVTGAPGIIGIHFTEEKPINATQVYSGRYCDSMYKLVNLFLRWKGIIYVGEGMFHLLPSVLHDDRDIESLVSSIRDLLEELKS